MAEPQQFMALVPAKRAMEMAAHIRKEYEMQFSRVKNRLPLHLNLVFFNRRQPLYAALDAARRMLQRPSKINEIWRIEKIGEAEDRDIQCHSQGRSGNRVRALRLYQISTGNATASLRHTFNTLVSYDTGDPNVIDEWYPYFFVSSASSNNPLEQRALRFKAPLPEGKTMTELVHVMELFEGDEIYYAPSTFDFEFLDVATRRFELFYDQEGRRLPRIDEAYPTRPYLLEDLDHFQTLWNEISRLSTTQIKQLQQEIENKRQAWQLETPDDPVLCAFAEHILRSAFGKEWAGIVARIRERLIEWAVSGKLNDLLELFMEILKKKSGRGRRNNVPNGGVQR